ncbi:MAG: leucine--tRNA ligase [Flavobacteriales bacterium]|nr:leucine--tRNA ligase [Flavobacteriales bacterium]
MDYDFRSIEKRWQETWNREAAYRVTETSDRPKYYVLDMFPYPSGAGLHVGHPLGYIASDIFARYKRLRGFNVLHPMGYDSFGLPAEQYAIQTGQHPAVTTETNIARYREQLGQLGFCYDWDREVRTSDPSYYRWTQWIFGQLFEAWYDEKAQSARPIEALIEAIESDQWGSLAPASSSNWWESLPHSILAQWGSDFSGSLTANHWKACNEQEKSAILMQFRLAYLADSEVNWCPELGTVLANDEVKDGLSERGGHPVVRKRMRQWIMRITAYADRLVANLDDLNWTDSIKEAQRNWIGRSEGASVTFGVEGHDESQIHVFTTRPDTMYGVSFMVLAPEHPLVNLITTEDQSETVRFYQEAAARKSERDRQGAGDKDISGCDTGAFAIHPLTGEKLPVWIADYVLAGYGTGAVMAVPAGDERDWKFAQHFHLSIASIFKGFDSQEAVCTDKKAILCDSESLNDLQATEAIPKAIALLEKLGKGRGLINFRIRDAVFSRQRYWGEPFPIYYENDVPKLIEEKQVTLPPVDAYLPTSEGEPPLARANKEDWNVFEGDRMEYNTMPGWAGSSWYFLRYMDPKNVSAFCSREKSDYWGQVDLYVGGAEHTTGHLLYSRFWTKFLFDRGFIGFNEPFKQMINQGMILGRSSFVYRIQGTQTFVTAEKRKEHKTQRLHVDIGLVQTDKLDLDGFRKWRSEFADAEFILNADDSYTCGHEVEKMSKSKFNVQTPDELVERYGADTLRCYEMFLGPLTQHKPWDTQGISGVHNFLRKLNRLYENLSDEVPTEAALRAYNKTVRKVTEDLDRHAFNTVISALMIGVNELTDAGCQASSILKPLAILVSPVAPHLAEELFQMAGGVGLAVSSEWPKWDDRWLTSDQVVYPVSFNGKVRFQMEAATSADKQEVETQVLADERTAKQLEGKVVRKIIVVPGRIINIVAN